MASVNHTFLFCLLIFSVFGWAIVQHWKPIAKYGQLFQAAFVPTNNSSSEDQCRFTVLPHTIKHDTDTQDTDIPGIWLPNLPPRIDTTIATRDKCKGTVIS